MDLSEADDASLARLVSDERVAHAEQWSRESISLLSAAVARIRSSVSSRIDVEYSELKRDALNEVQQQLCELLRTNAREIDEYMATLSEDKQREYTSIIQCAQRGRPPQPKHEAAAPKPGFAQLPAFQEDISAAVSALSTSGADTRSMTIMSDDCMYHRGDVYFKGSNILMRSKCGKMYPVVIDSLTKTEMDVLFKDNTSITVTDEDLRTGKVEISLS